MRSQIQLFSSVKAALLAVLLSFYLTAPALGHRAQNPPEPKRELLLNGLHVLTWQRPGDASVLIKLRVHSGAAFDLAGKAGMMALLGDAILPEQSTREYITEELGGRFEVATDFDSINVTLTGRAQSFERLLEILRTSLINMSLTAERVVELRNERSKLVRETSAQAKGVADRAVAARLFGDYPLGRTGVGATDTLARIDRADLLLARERFLNANNATLVIIGGVDDRRALRALRQMLGVWRKSEQIVPATFRQPEAPDTRPLIVDLPGAQGVEVRLAARGLKRSDRDSAAATVIALIARERWLAASPELARGAYSVRHETYVLPGLFLMSASQPPAEAVNALESARKVLQALATSQPTATEFERAKNEALSAFNRQLEQPSTLADLWLDLETYKLGSINEQRMALSNLTPADVQRVAARLFREAPVVSVAVGSAADLRAGLTRMGQVEVLGEQTAPKPAPVVSPTPKSP
jgi:predicted Zn-dependent peptidase